MKIILANGTLKEYTPKDNLHLWKALGVHVGRLGVITELTFRIKPQQAVKRKLQELSFEEFAAQVKVTQDAFNAAKAAGDDVAVRKSLAQLDETQALWHYALREIWRVDFEYLDKEPLSVLLNLDLEDPKVQAMSGPNPQGVYNQGNRQPVPPNNRVTTNPRFWANFYATTMRQFATPGTFEASKSFLSFSDFGARTTASFTPYNQLEVAIPLEIAGDCLMEVGAEMYGPAALWEGFRTPALIRFISGQDYYISNTHGGPRMYVNIEDYLSLTTGKPNTKFDRVVEIFLNRCKARLHYGKYGHEQYQPCFDGAKEYPEWCDFGCAVSELDPSNKFASQAKLWRWKATNRAGQQVDFASCCSANGFDKSRCQCASSSAC